MVAGRPKHGRTPKGSHLAGTPEPVRERFNEARTRAAELTESLKRTTHSLAEEATRKATQVTRVVKEGADELVSEQKERAAARVERLGAVFGQAARALRAGRIDKAAEYAEAAAGGIESSARYLRESDLPQMLDDVADLARQYPMLFLGGMFAAGLGVARFVKAADLDESSGAGGSARRGHAGRSRPSGGRRASKK